MDSLIILFLKTIAIGLILGFVFGFLLRKISKIILIVLALIIVFVIVAGFNDVLEINWLSLKSYIESGIENYLSIYEERLKIFLANLPFVIGMFIGFLYGLKKG